MLAIFKALKAMGGDWEVPKIRKAGGGSDSRSPSGSPHSRTRSRPQSRSRSRGSSLSSTSQDDYDLSDGGEERDISPGRRELHVHNGDNNEEKSRGRQRKHYSAANDWGYGIPEDPWVINARFRKDGMYPPGVAHPSSTHSSRADLQDAAVQRRRSSTNTSHSSLNHVEGGSVAGDSTTGSSRYPGADEAVFVYMTIQLYSIDRDFFVVDFKCAGYERLVANLVREIKASSTSSTSISQLALKPAGGHADGWDDEQGVWRQLDDAVPLSEETAREVKESGGVLRERTVEVGAGRKEGEKRCTSPFPFLDVASTLILQLSGE